MWSQPTLVMNWSPEAELHVAAFVIFSSRCCPQSRMVSAPEAAVAKLPRGLSILRKAATLSAGDGMVCTSQGLTTTRHWPGGPCKAMHSDRKGLVHTAAETRLGPRNPRARCTLARSVGGLSAIVRMEKRDGDGMVSDCEPVQGWFGLQPLP